MELQVLKVQATQHPTLHLAHSDDPWGQVFGEGKRRAQTCLGAQYQTGQGQGQRQDQEQPPPDQAQAPHRRTPVRISRRRG